MYYITSYIINFYGSLKGEAKEGGCDLITKLGYYCSREVNVFTH